ncbi:hypothetical protein JR316_0003079 [Psilocybe cubensis]|uniref:Uncharacterized protein n=1 Tax=Psilocybe cubensis TaxID=181762 RepID=A0ACB8H700_PSICU|nr:hypothetical protein JR316_0003079 [Psilocybe cubensis]KAH9483609.1 hypothetical protein JR316_0003079 [Psilocybe cubensis]
MSLLAPLIALYRYSLEPVAPFTWLGWGISSLDVVAAFRLCVLLRQIREDALKKHISTKGSQAPEEASFVKSASTTLLVVYGAPFLGQPPSFMISGIVPALYTAIQAIVDNLPYVPEISAELEVPLSLLDGFTRAYLFPVSLSVQTPPELKAYGWTTADLWCAPVVTGLYALLTHAQPYWAELHSILSGVLGSTSLGEPVKPLDPETARAVCALLLSGLFFGRTTKNFGLWKPFTKKIEPKVKTQ